MFCESDTTDLPTEHSTVNGKITIYGAVTSAVILALSKLLSLRT